MQNEAIPLVTMCNNELWLVEKNHATVKPDSSVASRGMKNYSKSRIELRNLQILKKMLEKSSQFLSSEQPCEPKSFDDVALKIAGVEKVPSENLWLQSTWMQFDSRFEWIERSVNDCGDICLLSLVILKSVWFSDPCLFKSNNVCLPNPVEGLLHYPQGLLPWPRDYHHCLLSWLNRKHWRLVIAFNYLT